MRSYFILIALGLLIALPRHAQLDLNYEGESSYEKFDTPLKVIDPLAAFANIFVVADNPFEQFALEYKATDNPNLNQFEDRISDLAQNEGNPSLEEDYDLLLGVESLRYTILDGVNFGGSLVSGLQAPAGTKVSTDQSVSTVIRIANNTDSEKNFKLISSLIFDSQGVGAPDIMMQEFISNELRMLKDDGGFLQPDEFFSDSISFSGFSSGTLGELFEGDDFSIPAPNTFRREAAGGKEYEFVILPGEVVLMVYTLNYLSSVENPSEFIGQYNGTQSLDFDVTIEAEGLDITFVPEPGSLALIAFAAPLVMRRRR